MNDDLQAFQEVKHKVLLRGEVFEIPVSCAGYIAPFLALLALEDPRVDAVLKSLKVKFGGELERINKWL